MDGKHKKNETINIFLKIINTPPLIISINLEHTIFFYSTSTKYLQACF